MSMASEVRQKSGGAHKEERSPYTLPKLAKHPASGGGNAAPAAPAAAAAHDDEMDPDHGFFAHIKSLKNAIRDRDSVIHHIRQENNILKQLANRQQKELEALEARYEDAPKLIRSLKQEISGLKQKMKTYYAQKANDVRNMRQLTEQVHKLSAENERLDGLVKESDLGTRHDLDVQLQEANKKIQELEASIQSSSKKAGMVEKTYTTESRNLRGKVHNLEHEGVNLKEKIGELEKVIRENQREIASLEIYRYNAIHRQKEGCKECARREKESSDKKRREEIFAKLPTLAPPSLEIQSIKSALLKLRLPFTDENTKYTSVRIRYQAEGDPKYDEIVVGKDAIPVRQERAPPAAPAATEGEAAVAVETTDAPADEPAFVEKDVAIEGLKAGHNYIFQLCACKDDVEGPLIESEPVYFDVIPNAPQKPAAQIVSSRSIHVHVPRDSDTNNAEKYRFYYAHTDAFAESFFLAEVDHSEDVIELEFEPQMNTWYYFRCTGSNKIGEGKPGPISEPVRIDTPPPKPSKPTVRYLSSTEVEITSQVTDERVEVSHFKVVYGLAEGGAAAEKKEIVVTDHTSHVLQHVISNLVPTKHYQFQMMAGNKRGEGELSECTIAIAPLPTPPAPKVDIVSPTSLRITFGKATEQLSLYKINNYKMVVRDSYSTAQVELLVPTDEQSVILDDLKYGGSYEFMLYYSNDLRDSEQNRHVHIDLAVCIPLPPTPTGDEKRRDSHQRSDPVSLSEAGKKGSVSSSRSTVLSFDEKVANLHQGNPAHFISQEALAGDAQQQQQQQALQSSSSTMDAVKKITLKKKSDMKPRKQAKGGAGLGFRGFREREQDAARPSQGSSLSSSQRWPRSTAASTPAAAAKKPAPAAAAH